MQEADLSNIREEEEEEEEHEVEVVEVVETGLAEPAGWGAAFHCFMPNCALGRCG